MKGVLFATRPIFHRHGRPVVKTKAIRRQFPIATPHGALRPKSYISPTRSQGVPSRRNLGPLRDRKRKVQKMLYPQGKGCPGCVESSVPIIIIHKTLANPSRVESLFMQLSIDIPNVSQCRSTIFAVIALQQETSSLVYESRSKKTHEWRWKILKSTSKFKTLARLLTPPIQPGTHESKQEKSCGIQRESQDEKQAA